MFPVILTLNSYSDSTRKSNIRISPNTSLDLAIEKLDPSDLLMNTELVASILKRLL